MKQSNLAFLLHTLIDGNIGGPYSSVYLSLGFLQGALSDDDARQDLIDYMKKEPKHLDKLGQLRDDLNAIMKEAGNANA